MPLTRAMFVTILYRMENEPETNAGNAFSDVGNGEYYEKAATWAKECGIVNGVSDSEFAPDEQITREQIAAMMFRYAAYKGLDISIEASGDYSDGGDISEYAKNAAQWARGKKIMQGFEDESFRPGNKATRAEAAAVFMNFIKFSE